MKTWETVLKPIQETARYKSLIKNADFLANATTVYPPKNAWFKALELTPYEAVKIVILGQDPYHQPHQAMGLSFSVPKTITIPPSLKNIYKELQDDIGFTPPDHGDLSRWAKAGVLLLNTALTVEASKPASHAKLGWHFVTNAVIDALNDRDKPVVFMLWGRHAIEKKTRITSRNHCILTAPHPSPLSAHRGFLGCRHFSKANTFLKKHGIEPVNFALDG